MVAWWRGLRAAGRIAARDARRARGRTALVAVMIGLPILVGTTGGTLLQSTVMTPSRYANVTLGKHAQAHIGGYVFGGVRQNATGSSFGGSDDAGSAPPTLGAHRDRLAAALPEGDRLVAVHEGAARLLTEDRLAPGSASVLEAPVGDLAALVVPSLESGALPTARGQVAVGRSWARALGVGVGDAIALQVREDDGRGGISTRDVPVVVSGVLAPSPSSTDVVAVLGTVGRAPETADEGRWFVIGDAPVTWDVVRAINEAGSVVRSRDPIVHPPSAQRLAAAGYGAEGPTTPDPGALAMVGAVVALALLEAVLLIGPAFAVGARRATRQLAVLAASGADRRHLRQVVLLGGVVIGCVASLTGIVIGVVVAAIVRWVCLAVDVYAFLDLRVPWPYLPGALALGVAVATAAAWLPARSASRQDIVAALSGRRAEARPRRSVPVVGLVVLSAGLAAAAVGARDGGQGFLVGGVVAIELGLVLCAGALVTLVGRAAPRLGVAGRFALRDAARQRGRTAPAVAAIVAAIAGVVTAAVYVESGEHHRRAQYAPKGQLGTVVVAYRADGDDAQERAAGVADALRGALPAREVVPVSLAVAPSTLEQSPFDAHGADVPLDNTWVAAERPADQRCPLDDQPWLHGGERRKLGRDPRCAQDASYQLVWTDPHGGGGTLVDDGALVSRLGFAGASEDAAALGAGTVLVSDARALWPDGSVHLVTHHWDVETGEDATVDTVVARGRVTDLPAPYGLVLPPAVVDDLGYVELPAGFFVTTSRIPTPEEEARAARAAQRVDHSAYLSVERGYTGEQPLVVWLLALAAVVVGLGATGISVALAGAESRPDLATLAAVGAAPGVRRRVAAAQAAVLVVLGVGVGTVTGLVLGRVLVVSERARFEIYDPTWLVVVPWPAIAAVALGVPSLATGGAWLLTRSRLPMVSRIPA